VREERLNALVSRIVTRQGGITFNSERELLQRLRESANGTRVLKRSEIRARLPEPRVLAKDATTPRDVFLCHASEDKSSVAEPLTRALDEVGISYWYDQAEIKWGDSVTGKVNEGLKISLYVIVVLSKAFIGKHWPNRELSAALNIEASTGETRVLPLIVGLENERHEVLTEFPLLSDKLYLVWDGTSKAIVDALTSRLAGSSYLRSSTNTSNPPAEQPSVIWLSLKGRRVRLEPLQGLRDQPTPDPWFRLEEATDSDVRFKKESNDQHLHLPLSCLSNPWGSEPDGGVRATIERGQLYVDEADMKWKWKP
jgi:hypothetical protein